MKLGQLQVMAGGPFVIGSGVTHLRERDHLALYVGGMGAKGRYCAFIRCVIVNDFPVVKDSLRSRVANLT